MRDEQIEGEDTETGDHVSQPPQRPALQPGKPQSRGAQLQAGQLGASERGRLQHRRLLPLPRSRPAPARGETPCLLNSYTDCARHMRWCRLHFSVSPVDGKRAGRADYFTERLSASRPSRIATVRWLCAATSGSWVA